MENEGKSFEDLLNDEPSEAAPVVEEVPAEQEGQPRDEHGRFAPKGEEEGAPPAPVEPPAFDGAATIDERRKRQAAEQERDELRTRLEALEKQFQPPPKEPAPQPSIWEDEQGWQQHFGSNVVQQATLNAKLDMSEMLARRQYEDFDAMKTSFLQMAEQNPAIVQQALGDPDPWDRAYKIARNAATMTELGATDLETLKAKIREELVAEMGQQPSPTGLPPTLSTERNVGSRSGPAWSGPKPLSELLG